MLAWLLDSLSMQVLVTWHIATGEASSNLADLNLGGLWFGAKDLAKEADLKASSGWMSWWTRHFEDYNGPVVERPMQGRDIAGIFPIIWRINCYFLTIVHWISSASCHMIVAHLGIAMGELQWIFLTWRGDFFDLWSCSMD